MCEVTKGIQAGRTIKHCEHCDKEIGYDSQHRMWYTVGGKQFYCPQDHIIEHCQHLPKD